MFSDLVDVDRANAKTEMSSFNGSTRKGLNMASSTFIDVAIV